MNRLLPGAGVIGIGRKYAMSIVFASRWSGCDLEVSCIDTYAFELMQGLVNLDFAAFWHVRRDDEPQDDWRCILFASVRDLVAKINDIGSGLSVCTIDGIPLTNRDACAVARDAVAAVAARLGVEPRPVPTIPPIDLTRTTRTEGRA